jgi:hypothetical protein
VTRTARTVSKALGRLAALPVAPGIEVGYRDPASGKWLLIWRFERNPATRNAARARARKAARERHAERRADKESP